LVATHTARPRYRWIAALVCAAALAPAAPAEAAQLVRYDTGGGIAGRSMRLVVSAGGTAVQTDRDATDSKRFKISISQLHALKRELKAAEFSTLKRRYEPKYVVNDGTSTGVTYKGKTVVVTSGGNPPERLNKVLNRLARLMRQ
jgi:hypothetical protein